MTEIPNAFGGFAPFPNTIMIPTMGLQSDVIGFRFGFGYEKGKRTLRAMSNEQFNTLDEAAEQAIYKEHDTTAINFFKLELQNWTNLQHLIIEKSVEIETMKANRTPSAFREIFNGFTAGFTAQQSNDAGNFFSSLTDPIMKLLAYFGSGKTSTINNPSIPPSFTNPPATNIPSPSPQSNKGTTLFWVYSKDSVRPSIQQIKIFLAKAYPKQVTISNITSSGASMADTNYQGVNYKIKLLFRFSWISSFPLPAAISVSKENLRNV